MKLSNKILISLFGFIFLYLTAAFTEVRFRGTPNIIDDSNSIAETADISGVTYLVLHDLEKSINVVASEDQPRIEVRSFSGDILQKLKYSISDDTLTISQLELKENMRIKISVYVPNKRFKGIMLNGADVVVEDLDQETLNISQNAGRIRMVGNNRIEKLHIEAVNDGDFSMSDAEVNTLSVLVENSRVNIYSPVRLLKGSLTNKSYMRMTGVDEIQFKKDKSSTLHFY